MYFQEKISELVEGGGFGLPPSGLLDGPLSLIQRLVSKGGAGFMEQVQRAGLFELVCTRLSQHLHGYGEVSVGGLIGALRLVYYMVAGCRATDGRRQYTTSGEPLGGLHLLAKHGLAAVLIKLLDDEQLKTLSQWPESRGGGRTGVAVTTWASHALAAVPLQVPSAGSK